MEVMLRYWLPLCFYYLALQKAEAKISLGCQEVREALARYARQAILIRLLLYNNLTTIYIPMYSTAANQSGAALLSTPFTGC